jgi:hypothetical protein
MKPYGLNRIEAGDLDVVGCINGGRATHFYSITARAFKALRNGAKDTIRRIHKRRARAQSKKLCSEIDE